jgi:hypothetical protein
MQIQIIKCAYFITSLLIFLVWPTIANAVPAISINDVSVTEGANAKASFTISISANPASRRNVSVSVSTANGSAVSGKDYTSTNKTLTFQTNQPLSQTFEVPILNDTIAESTEAFMVKLTNPKNATIADNSGTGTILDDDNAPPPVNHAPTCAINTPSATITISPGQAVNYSATISDVDNNLTTIAWIFMGGAPSSSNVEDPGNVLYSQPGTYSATLTATDVQGATCQPQNVTVIVNQPPVCVIDTPTNDVAILAGRALHFTATVSDPENDALTLQWTFNGGNPASSAQEDPGSVTYTTPTAPGEYYLATLSASDSKGAICAQKTRKITVKADPNISINSTSSWSFGQVTDAVSEQPKAVNSNFNVLAINDLGMHCMDLDDRIANILPPFQVMLAQVIQKGDKPVINPAGVELYYSAASNPNDPILNNPDIYNGLDLEGNTFKTNFWYAVERGSYDQFYPSLVTPLLGGPFNVTQDTGLPVPNVENLYIGPDGIVDGNATGSHDGYLSAVQHTTSGIANPYNENTPKKVNEHYDNKPMFVNFPFGYVAPHVNWFEAAGIPAAFVDDFGRENPFPLFRVQAKSGGSVVASVDTVLPVSGETSCTNCHSAPTDTDNNRSDTATKTLVAAGLPVATSNNDPDPKMPVRVSREYGADINILRLHDLKHGADYVDTANQPAVCDITANNGNGSSTCLTNLALVQSKPVICQGCHYTPALDLAHVGPMSGPTGTFANGRNQMAHQTNSRVMHNFHGQFTDLFPAIPAPEQDATTGIITNQNQRIAALENNCYQCHPGKDTKCLRGAMFNGDMLCSDCHGSLKQVGDDFSKQVSTNNPGAFTLAKDFYTNPNTPRVPWANEPGCGSCHTGDALSNLAKSANVIANKMDSKSNVDGIRLRQAFLNNDPKATPIVPTNKRFAEPAAAASFNGFNNPGAGNPELYRVSTGHGGIMCEGCHGPTHAEWPVANSNANDNIAANQIQSHIGPISECSACHTTSALPGNTQNGPHGMHLVNDSRFWREAHKDAAKAQNSKPGGGTCGACHGSDHLGTVLSRVPVTRTFTVESTVRKVDAGKPVACNLCHSISKSFGG